LFATTITFVWFIQFTAAPSLQCIAPQRQQQELQQQKLINNNLSTPNAFMTMMLENANRKIAERHAWLSKKHKEGSYFGAITGAEMWYMFLPTYPCLWTMEKQPSSAEIHDGGKWLCGLQEVHTLRSERGKTYGVHQLYNDTTKCIVYSMGSNNEFSFERRIRTVAPGCEVHTFDPTVVESGDGKDAYDTYHGDYGFGGKDATKGLSFPIKSIATIMNELKHTHVDYLKVDVEGYEWNFLSEVEWGSTRVGHILIELHPALGLDRKKLTALDLDTIFTRLEDAGFYLISLEPVTRSDYRQVELVFLHKNWPIGYLVESMNRFYHFECKVIGHANITCFQSRVVSMS
jgi:FkbM family methyltransferase